MNTTNNTAAARALIKKYREGTCSPKEEQQVLRWYYGFDATDDLDLQQEYKSELLQRVRRDVLTAMGKPKQPKIIFLLKPVIGIAAILTLTFLTFLFYSKAHKTDRVLHYSKLSTRPGERKMVQLKDGTRVWLNNASKLTWPENFSDSIRDVSLEGEAFFEVAHDSHKPFIIQTQKLNVQVLGTSFDVKSFKDENEVSVTVATGKVAVSKTDQHNYLMLLPGERAVYKTISNSLEKELADIVESRAWQNNILTFKYESLGNIFKSLERWYGVEIKCSHPKLLNKKYTLKQEKESLDNVLKVLSSGDFHYKITGGTVEIWP